MTPNNFQFLSQVAATMNVSQTIETEEDLPACLHIKLYNPQQIYKGLYSLLPFGSRTRHTADEPVKLGRDSQACIFALADPRVSRKQLSLHAYRVPGSTDMLFSIQNLSQRGKITVNGSVLGYLERLDLPDKTLIRFGEYELLIIRESGEALGCFEVDFEVLTVPPSRESSVPTMTPIMDTDVRNRLSADLSERGPLETDETVCF